MTPQESKLEALRNEIIASPNEVAKRNAISLINDYLSVVEGDADDFSAYFGLEDSYNSLMHKYFLREMNLNDKIHEPALPEDYRFTDVIDIEGTVLSRQVHVDSSGSICGIWYVAGNMRNTLVASQTESETHL